MTADLTFISGLLCGALVGGFCSGLLNIYVEWRPWHRTQTELTRRNFDLVHELGISRGEEDRAVTELARLKGFIRHMAKEADRS